MAIITAVRSYVGITGVPYMEQQRQYPLRSQLAFAQSEYLFPQSGHAKCPGVSKPV